MAFYIDGDDKPYLHYSLDDGTTIVFRPIVAEDAPRLKAGFKLLSKNSVYTRFFSYKKVLSDEQIQQLTHLDPHDHVAWGAGDPMRTDLPGVGVGRYIRINKSKKVEFATTVIDEYQNKGIGILLLAILWIMARYNGYNHLVGYVMPENKAMLKNILAIDGKSTFDNGVYRVEVPLYKSAEAITKSPFSERYIQTIKTLKPMLAEVTGIDAINTIPWKADKQQ